MNDDAGLDEELVRRATRGEEAALAELFARHRGRLRQMVRLRLDRRLQGRVDPSDVLQDAYIDLAAKLPEYASRRGDAVLPLAPPGRRRAAAAASTGITSAPRCATPGREISLHRGALPQASSASLAAQLLGRMTSASRAADRAELQSAPGGAQRDGPDRPRDHRPAPLRGADQRRGRRGARPEQGRRQQALRPGHAPAQGRARGYPGLADAVRGAGRPDRPARARPDNRRPDAPWRRPCRRPAEDESMRTTRSDEARSRTFSPPSSPTPPPGRAAGGRASTPPAIPSLAEEIRELFPALADGRGAQARRRRRPSLRRRGRAPGAGPGLGAAGRLPDPPRDRPRGDGRRLRGRAGVASAGASP